MHSDRSSDGYANTMEGDRDPCLLAGMNDYIAKPVSAPGLARILENWAVPQPSRAAAATDRPRVGVRHA